MWMTWMMRVWVRRVPVNHPVWNRVALRAEASCVGTFQQPKRHCIIEKVVWSKIDKPVIIGGFAVKKGVDFYFTLP